MTEFEDFKRWTKQSNLSLSSTNNKDLEWQPIKTAPKNKIKFIALIDNLPYLAYYDGPDRFIYRTHGNIAAGQTTIKHEFDGKELDLIIKKEEEANYQPQSYLWRVGFEYKPTHWLLLPTLPKD